MGPGENTPTVKVWFLLRPPIVQFRSVPSVQVPFDGRAASGETSVAPAGVTAFMNSLGRFAPDVFFQDTSNRTRPPWLTAPGGATAVAVYFGGLASAVPLISVASRVAATTTEIYRLAVTVFRIGASITEIRR